jgi:hypothetical protein
MVSGPFKVLAAAELRKLPTISCLNARNTEMHATL